MAPHGPSAEARFEIVARLLGKSWGRNLGRLCKSLNLLASPTGFEPVLPP